MQQMLKPLAVLVLFTGVAFADSKVATLPAVQSPIPAGSCLYVDQGPGVDTKLCNDYATALGINASGANTIRGNFTSSAGNDIANPAPSCPDTSGNHLNYVTSTGLVCGTSSQPLARTFSSPSNPTGTVSTTSVMMGLAGTITPTTSGKIHFVVVGVTSNTSANGSENIRLNYGTGAAPTNGAALTGTALGTTKGVNANAASEIQSFALEGYATGFALGTAVWIDVSLSRGSAGTASIASVDIYAEEM